LPTAVILLDELEKAHKVLHLALIVRTVLMAAFTKDVAMILLQILDEGSITDSQGRKVDFKACSFFVDEVWHTQSNLRTPSFASQAISEAIY
jgi:hypothetical protein